MKLSKSGDLLMINVVIPMAGRGKRFLDKGIETPKPLIEINSEPFISHVIDNVKFGDVFFYFLIREDHLKSYDFDSIFKKKKIKYKNIAKNIFITFPFPALLKLKLLMIISKFL